MIGLNARYKHDVYKTLSIIISLDGKWLTTQQPHNQSAWSKKYYHILRLGRYILMKHSVLINRRENDE